MNKMKDVYIILKFITLTLCAGVFTFSANAQTAVGSSGPSPVMTINGQNYQGYCVEYSQGAAPSGHSYFWDDTPEDITDPKVTAAMRGMPTYGVSATQNAVWYFTDGVSPSSGSSAWDIINLVNNGTYQPTCASEWVPNNWQSYQDIMTWDDPHCNGSCDIEVTINNNGSCPVDIYWWRDSGDEYYTTIQAGGSWTVTTHEGHVWRATSSPTDWQNLLYDEHYTTTDDCNQTWNIHPDYCDINCENCSVVDDCTFTNAWFGWATGPGAGCDWSSHTEYPSSGGASIEYCSDGSAKVTVTVTNNSNSNEIWDICMYLKNPKDWATWSAGGGMYMEDPHNLHETWTYYIIDESRSFWKGVGSANQGQIAYMTHKTK